MIKDTIRLFQPLHGCALELPGRQAGPSGPWAIVQIEPVGEVATTGADGRPDPEHGVLTLAEASPAIYREMLAYRHCRQPDVGHIRRVAEANERPDGGLGLATTDAELGAGAQQVGAIVTSDRHDAVGHLDSGDAQIRV